MCSKNHKLVALKLSQVALGINLAVACQTSSLLAMNATQGIELAHPLFPSDNWWNADIRTWPVDSNSVSYIAFINNGGSRRLHPDFGGDSGGNGIYGMPYAVVTGVTAADLKAVTFDYFGESDGVDHTTDQSIPFYPIPPEAITQPRWIEGGDPGNVNPGGDRHLIIVDKDNNYLYELYAVFYDNTLGQWQAGSGAFFDMNTNNRRPDGWTSADAAGLAILPGLVRYDEVYNAAVPEIVHAFRVTTRATNGFVYPASHRAGNTTGALPMGARLRLKSSVDVTQRTNDANVQKIFRAMQTYGLIVADNGSDMFITGAYDVRWNNDILNPAFAALTASDFEVIELGYNPQLISYSLTVIKVGNGTVTSAPAGINCGTTCNANFTSATSVVLTATAATSSTFGGWSNACTGTALTCTVNMNAAKTATATFNVASKPDFTIPVMTIAPVTPVTNGTFTATVTVKNQGTVAADGGQLRLWTNQPTVPVCAATGGNKNVAVGTLAAGASKTFTITGLGAGAGGFKTLRAFVDATCVSAESNETNNQRTLGYRVAGRLPDLIVTNIAITPATPAKNTVFNAAITIKNQGLSHTTMGYLDVWTNQATTQTCGAIGNAWAEVGALAAGASKVITLPVASGVAGSKTLRAFVDSWCEILEANETNNQMIKTYSVQ